MGEKKCLVTQNLIESVKWYMEAPTSIIKPERGGDGVRTWKSKALQDLKDMLGRVPGEFGPEAMNGVNFEKKVYEFCNKEDVKGSDHFKEVCSKVRGMQFYRKGGKDVKVGEYDCYVYAKYDAIQVPRIKDIKTTAKYTKNKYLGSIQHKLYCYVADANEFEYVIVEWKKFPEIKAVHSEWFTVPAESGTKYLEPEVHSAIIDCFDNLQNLDLWDLYRESYCLY